LSKLILPIVSAMLASVWALTAAGYNNPPYEVYPYVADATDDPPVNYMKVVEPGRTGEANASYVVLGISFPRTYQAVAGNYDKDLVIPAYIDGLPVRKINETAFIECNLIKSVKIPSTVREVGARAFVDCLSLTNVVFEEGVSVIGDSAFSNCVSLTELRFPKTLSRLGVGCFQGCVGLTDVYFAGNAPRLPRLASTTGSAPKSILGESLFRQYGYYERCKIHINRNTRGWISPYETGVPEKWPTDYGYMSAHETVAEDLGPTAPGAGFVTVITEIKGTAVAVPETWALQFPQYKEKFGSDFAASLLRPTGKKVAAGENLVVWQDYVAGTDPTKTGDVFTATIRIVDGEPIISYLPVLSEAETARRKYTTYGRTSLYAGDWSVVAPGTAANYNFFKVTVEMR